MRSSLNRLRRFCCNLSFRLVAAVMPVSFLANYANLNALGLADICQVKEPRVWMKAFRPNDSWGNKVALFAWGLQRKGRA